MLWRFSCTCTIDPQQDQPKKSKPFRRQDDLEKKRRRGYKRQGETRKGAPEKRNNVSQETKKCKETTRTPRDRRENAWISSGTTTSTGKLAWQPPSRERARDSPMIPRQSPPNRRPGRAAISFPKRTAPHGERRRKTWNLQLLHRPDAKTPKSSKVSFSARYRGPKARTAPQGPPPPHPEKRCAKKGPRDGSKQII